jgi:hypothetical protein
MQLCPSLALSSWWYQSLSNSGLALFHSCCAQKYKAVGVCQMFIVICGRDGNAFCLLVPNAFSKDDWVRNIRGIVHDAARL